MRKLISLLMAFLLLFSILPAMAEGTAPTDNPESDTDKDLAEVTRIQQKIEKMMYGDSEDNRYYNGLVQLSGKMYAITYEGVICAYDEATQAWNKLEDKAPLEYGENEYASYARATTDGQSIYMLNSELGLIVKATVEDDGYTLERYLSLPWDDMRVQEGEYSYSRDTAGVEIVDGTFYFLVQNDSWEYELQKYDAEKNVFEKLDFSLAGQANLQEFTPYKDGFAMASWDSLYYYDMKTGEVETLLSGKNNLCNLTTGNGILYFSVGDEIWSDRDGKFAVVGYGQAGADNYGRTDAVIYNENTYVYLNGNEVASVNVSEDNMPEFNLSVVGQAYYLQAAIKEFAKEYPDIPVSRDESQYFSNAQALTEHMKGANAADIYIVDVQNVNLSLLAKKEYVLPLDSAILGEKPVNEKIAAACSYNGQLYAVPVGVYANSVYGVSVKAFEKIGLTADDIPSTYDELLQFINDWQEQYAEEFPEMTLFEDMQYIDLKNNLLHEILHAYELKCLANGENISFNSPELNKTLESLAKTDFTGFYAPENEGTSVIGRVVSIGGDDSVPSSLFSNYFDAMLGYHRDDSYQLMPLALNENDDSSYIGLNLTVAVVNPESKHQEEAKALLSKVIGNLDNNYRFAILPEENEPVINEYLVQSLEKYEIGMAELDQEYAAASEEVQALLKDYVDMMKQNYDYMQKHRYEVSAEDIAAFREREKMFVVETSTMLYGSEEITTLFSRFRDGSINVSTFLHELSRKVEMMIMEGD